MTKIKKEFKITSKLPTQKSVVKSLDLNEDGSLDLEGVASTTNVDLQGDTITKECIEKMKQQALNRNIHADHIYDLNDVIGAITDVYDTNPNVLKIKFRIIPSVAPKIKELLDTGVHLGLSIGGTILDYAESYTDDGDYGWIVKDINLLEISLTPLPANWDTMGTVTTAKGVAMAKCLSGACYEIRKNMNIKKEVTEDEVVVSEEESNQITPDNQIEIDDEANDDEIESTDEDTGLTSEDVRNIVISALEGFKAGNNNDDESNLEKEENQSNMVEEIKNAEITEEDVMNMINEVSGTMKEQVVAEVKDTVKSEITENAKIEIRDQITDELLSEIKNDVVNEVKSEVIGSVIDELTEKYDLNNSNPTEPGTETDETKSVEEAELEKALEEIDEEPETEVKEEVEEPETEEEEIEEVEEPETEETKSVKSINDQEKINYHRLERNVEKNVEARILADLGISRNPETQTERFVKKWLASKEEPRINNRKVMSKKELAERMTDTSNTQSPYYRALKEMQKEE